MGSWGGEKCLLFWRQLLRFSWLIMQYHDEIWDYPFVYVLTFFSPNYCTQWGHFMRKNRAPICRLIRTCTLYRRWNLDRYINRSFREKLPFYRYKRYQSQIKGMMSTWKTTFFPLLFKFWGVKIFCCFQHNIHKNYLLFDIGLSFEIGIMDFLDKTVNVYV